MKYRHALIGGTTLAVLLAGTALPALAASSAAVAAATPTPIPAPHQARAWIRLDIGRANGAGSRGAAGVWVGESIPIVVTARFRDVEGVTLEGAPELKSETVFTSDLARDPRQSNEVVDGESVLVATWTGTITPSTSGPIALSVKLPVRLRYHEAVAQPAFQDPLDGDPFAAMDIDPSDPTSIQRLFRSFQQSVTQRFAQLGRGHDDALTLKASSASMEVKPLPTAGQPAVFSGAVGQFAVRASVDATHVKTSDPITLHITVKGEGDLDRVELPGLATSDDWKAYPATSTIAAASPGKRERQKRFDQVLIPLHGGTLTIPPVALSTFDPVVGRYTSVETSPLELTVDGPPAPPPSADPAATSASPAAIPAIVAPEEAFQAPSPGSLVDSPRTLALRIAPVLAALLAAVAWRLWRRRPDEERTLRRALRRTARRGSVEAFFEAARRLIVVHFARRWGVAEGAVTPDFLRQHLGPTAQPLVAAITSADALRFGRRALEPTELWMVCSTIEESLRDAR